MSVSKPTKSAKKDTPSGATLSEIVSLLEQTRQDMFSQFSSLELKLDKINSTLENHAQCLSLVEEVTKKLDRRCKDLERVCSTLKEHNSKLTLKVMDLESRSRRQNLRILGLPETVEGGSPVEFFSNFLCEIFGSEILSSPPEIDRAHRIFTSRSADGQRPRPVIIRLHRYQIKDLLIKEARRRKTLQYKGHAIHLVEDYAPQVMSQRAEYRGVMKVLYDRGLHPSLAYPARLRIKLRNGDFKRFDSVAEAQTFIDSLSATSSSSDTI